MTFLTTPELVTLLAGVAFAATLYTAVGRGGASGCTGDHQHHASAKLLLTA